MCVCVCVCVCVAAELECVILQADDNWDATSLHQFRAVGCKTEDHLMCFRIIKEKSVSFVWAGVRE